MPDKFHSRAISINNAQCPDLHTHLLTEYISAFPFWQASTRTEFSFSRIASGSMYLMPCPDTPSTCGPLLAVTKGYVHIYCNLYAQFLCLVFLLQDDQQYTQMPPCLLKMYPTHANERWALHSCSWFGSPNCPQKRMRVSGWGPMQGAVSRGNSGSVCV